MLIGKNCHIDDKFFPKNTYTGLFDCVTLLRLMAEHAQVL